MALSAQLHRYKNKFHYEPILLCNHSHRCSLPTSLGFSLASVTQTSKWCIWGGGWSLNNASHRGQNSRNRKSLGQWREHFYSNSTQQIGCFGCAWCRNLDETEVLDLLASSGINNMNTLGTRNSLVASRFKKAWISIFIPQRFCRVKLYSSKPWLP